MRKKPRICCIFGKNHSFVDGNKRIAAAVFLRFAEKNNLIYDKDGNKRVANNALVAMTLMVAESNLKKRMLLQRCWRI